MLVREEDGPEAETSRRRKLELIVNAEARYGRRDDRTRRRSRDRKLKIVRRRTRVIQD
jgi:hypothetical protein